MIKASKITLGLFSSGFLLYSLYKYFSRKNISQEQITKIIKKISNISIYSMFQYYDAKYKIYNQKKEFNDNIKEKIKIIKDEDEIDNEVLNLINQIEAEEIKKELNITKEEFEEYLIEYINNKDNEIIKYINLKQKVFNSLKQRKLPEINFGFIIPEKYLQIISNLFYFNVKKTYLIYHNKIKNSLNLSYKKKVFNDIYNSILTETRNYISHYFGIDKDNTLEINIKLALKIFPFYYDIAHPLRKKYQEIKNEVNKIINLIIKIEYKIDVFTNDNNSLYVKEPVDKIINFADIINIINMKKDFYLNNEEFPYEDQCD